jgi:hypothetical protein
MNTATQSTPAAASHLAARIEAIAQLNDEMRRNPVPVDKRAGKRAVITRAVNQMGPEFLKRALAAVAAFDQFTSGDNVHSERDYGLFRVDDVPLLFKITYLDVDGIYASEDPADAAQTLRVLTIMLASEY